MATLKSKGVIVKLATGSTYGQLQMPTDPDFDEHCPAELMANGEPNTDHSHCDCWYDGDPCCRCKAPAMTEEQKREQGMIEE